MLDEITWQLIDETAKSLGVKRDARRKWRERGHSVPASWQIKIVSELRSRGVMIAFEDFDRMRTE